MTRALRLLALAGLLAAEGLVALTYAGFGTWWHYLLHQLIGWGLGLAVAALVTVATGRRVPVVAALVGGQLVSIVPDLIFRFLRMPHEASMDVFVGHISIHTGPSPVLVALGTLLLGGWAWTAGAYGRRRPAAVLAVGALALVALACLTARDLPARLQDYPRDTAPLAAANSAVTNPADSIYARATRERRWFDT